MIRTAFGTGTVGVSRQGAVMTVTGFRNPAKRNLVLPDAMRRGHCCWYDGR
ncbi:MAG: hypothetical protein ACLUS6_07765 [Dysosmobacter sp.]